MKKRIAAAVILICGFVFLFPVSILNHAADGCVYFIRYNPNFGKGEPEYDEVKIYEEAKILECLSRYKEYRTPIRTESYNLNDMELEICIGEGEKSKTILLGNVNYTAEFYGSMKRGIYNADALREELLGILELPEYAEE